MVNPYSATWAWIQRIAFVRSLLSVIATVVAVTAVIRVQSGGRRPLFYVLFILRGPRRTAVLAPPSITVTPLVA
uniref:hypothetical protein n=1 Tax=Cupriavidus yeoncheonensis TaxID=1462994 RepID=UPI003F493D2C